MQMLEIKKQDPEKVNKTFRLPKSLVDRMEQIAQAKNISLNARVVQFFEYGLAHLKADTDEVE